MSNDTSHKLDRKLSDIVKEAARERPGEHHGAIKRANHEMAFIWLSLQDPGVMADVYADDSIPFDSLEDVRRYVYDDLFDGDDDFAPNRYLNSFARDAISQAFAEADAEQRGLELGDLVRPEGIDP